MHTPTTDSQLLRSCIGLEKNCPAAGHFKAPEGRLPPDDLSEFCAFFFFFFAQGEVPEAWTESLHWRNQKQTISRDACCLFVLQLCDASCLSGNAALMRRASMMRTISVVSDGQSCLSPVTTKLACQLLASCLIPGIVRVVCSVILLLGVMNSNRACLQRLIMTKPSK
jgi:hypothetical protein